jgi:hypothetical protein
VTTPESIRWPAVLQQAGDPELLWLPDAAAWSRHAVQLATHPDDCLVDSAGLVFHVLRTADGTADLQATPGKLSLLEVLGLVKAHAAQAGSCCVAKLYAPDIAAAIRMVAELDAEDR